MARRPYWSGQIRISLVFLPVNVYSATIRNAQISLHEVDRKTMQRIHHQNIVEDGSPVEDDDIVKAYEVEPDQYVLLEDEELAKVKLPSSDTLELTQFVGEDAIPLPYFERPYYVLPDGENAQEIYAVLRDALKDAKKIGVGQIALRGREELCALLPLEKGMLLQTLRYNDEIREPKEFFDEVKDKKSDAASVKLARELIAQKSGKLDLSQFHDHYREALSELIEAKKEDREPHYIEEEKKPQKVVNLMDALRKSLKTNGDDAPKNAAKKPAAKAKKLAAKAAAPRKRKSA